MKLIILYGPMAVGKLTVAKELANITGYKLFHNHLTVDLVGSLFEFNSPHYKKLNRKFRIELIEDAAKQDLFEGLIFTFCFAKKFDIPFITKLRKAVSKHKGTIHFVHLNAPREILFNRVLEPSREKFDKIKSKDHLEKVLDAYDLSSSIPEVESLEIDNSTVEPLVVAKKIKKHYSL